MAWRIEKIEIKNFKFFKETFLIRVNGKNLLLYGENGSGKSSIYWSVYTHFQAYAKDKNEAQKYFVADNPQNLRNRYAEVTDDSSIKIFFNNGEGTTKAIEDSNSCYYADDEETLRFMRFTAMSSDFMNYKFLSSLFDFKNSEENEVFSLFEKEVLPYIDLDEPLFHIDGTRTGINNASEWWKYINGTSSGLPRSQKTNHFDQRTPEYKSYQVLINKFNSLFKNKITFIILRANAILKEAFQLEIKIDFLFTGVFFNTRLAKRRFDGELHPPKIHLTAEVLSSRLVDKSAIKHPKSFFNEAKITCIALALRLAILESHPSSLEAPSILFIDDLLISLDMSFRRKVISLLMPYTRRFQTFIFTHDRAFYHLVNSEIKINGVADEWMKYELYKQNIKGIPIPCLFEGKSHLEKALMYLHNLEIPASVNALRSAAEQEMKRLLPKNLVLNMYTDNIKCDLNGLIQRYCKFARDIGLPDVAPHLQDERQLLLNPFSHDDIDTPFYRTELELTIKEIESITRISSRIIINYDSLHDKEYILRVECSTRLIELTLTFREVMYEYKYEGIKYYNSPKVKVERSNSKYVECKQWGLRKLFKEVCHYVFRSQHDYAEVMNYLKEL